MKEETLKAIFRQVVADMAYVPGRQTNCFVCPADAPALDHPAFGAAYTDYIAGDFYARSWVNAGADIQSFCGEHPALFIEINQVSVQDLYDPKYTADVALMIVDRVPCEDCPPHQIRTANSVAKNVHWMLRNILAEMSRYRLYEVTRAPAEVTFQWMTVARMLEDPTILSAEVRDDMQSYIQPDVFTFARWGSPVINGMKDKVAYWVMLRVDLCEELDAEFEHTPGVPGLATTVCQC